MKKLMILLVTFCCVVSLETVSAKSYRSSGFSSSRSYSRPSYSSRTPTKTSSFSGNKTTKTVAKPVTKSTTTSKFKTTKSQQFSKKYEKPKGFSAAKNSQAKASHKQHINKFKKPVNTASASPKQYTNNTFVRSSRQYNSSTRDYRRDNYYNHYSPPMYAYNSSSSFGMWDSMMLWYMLDNISNRNQSAMAYNHSNDPGFQEWRIEANKLAKDNEELRMKLSKLDTSVGTMTGIKNDNYIPPGMDADLMLSSEINNYKADLKICAGSSTGTYSKYAYKLKSTLSDEFNVSVIHTNGSNDNIVNLDNGKCDIAITQRDVFDLYTMCSNSTTSSAKSTCDSRGIKYSHDGTTLDFSRIATPFNDTVIGICNNNIKHFEDAKSISLVNGGGDNITWNNLVLEFHKLDKLTIVKSTSMSNSLDNVLLNKSDCALIVTNINSPILDTLDEYYTAGTNVLHIQNDKISKIKDPVGNSVYTEKRLSANKFGKAGRPLAHGFISKTINTIQVPVDVLISNKFDKLLTEKIKQKMYTISL